MTLYTAESISQNQSVPKHEEQLSLPRPLRLTQAAGDLPDHLTAGSAEVVLRNGISSRMTGIRGGVITGGDASLLFVNTHAGPNRAVCVQESTLFRDNLAIDLDRPAMGPPNPQRDAIQEIDRPVVFIGVAGANAVYHWLHDCLPRLLVAHQAGLSDWSIAIPAPNGKNGYIEESLDILGVDQSRIIRIHDTPLKAPEIWVVEDLFFNCPAHQQLLEMVRDELLDGALQQSAEAQRAEKIFVWRTGDRRGLQNPHEVEQLLIDHNIAKVSMEEFGLAEQIRTAHQADLMVGPHGAGLIHALFMGGGHVVELFPYDPSGARNAPCWDRILAVHGAKDQMLRWSAINSSIVPLSETTRDLFRIEVDCELLESVLTERRFATPPHRWSVVNGDARTLSPPERCTGS